MKYILTYLLIISLFSACSVEKQLSSKEKDMVDVISKSEKSQPVKVLKRRDGKIEVEYPNTKYVIKSRFVLEVFERKNNGWVSMDVKNEQ